MEEDGLLVVVVVEPLLLVVLLLVVVLLLLLPPVMCRSSLFVKPLNLPPTLLLLLPVACILGGMWSLPESATRRTLAGVAVVTNSSLLLPVPHIVVAGC
jgi:hypothetical protein